MGQEGERGRGIGGGGVCQAGVDGEMGDGGGEPAQLRGQKVKREKSEGLTKTYFTFHCSVIKERTNNITNDFSMSLQDNFLVKILKGFKVY